MILIVHWKDVVGRDNLEMFVKVQRAIIFAERDGRSETDVFKKMKNREDDISFWRKKRYLMRFCGYEIIDSRSGMWTRHGWYKPYLDHENMRFMCTGAKEDRSYIELSAFLDWKDSLRADDMEPRPGEVEDMIDEINAAHSVRKGATRQDYLDGFIREETVA